MSATETIISFAAKQVIDRVFGGATSIVTAYHKTHFIVLARAIAESNRDAKIQESLSEVKKNINGLPTLEDKSCVPFQTSQSRPLRICLSSLIARKRPTFKSSVKFMAKVCRR
jgi:hypothetical protein